MTLSPGLARRFEAAWALVREHEARNVWADPARRRHGRYYTPVELVRLLVARTLGPLAWRARVLDPACGAGAFLLGAVEHLVRAGVSSGGGEASVCRAVVERVRGIDTDGDALGVAREALRLVSGVTPPGLFQADALARPLVEVAGPVDAVLGNPPWLREKDAAHALREARATPVGRRWATARMDLWYLFAHAALEAAPRRHGFVVPAYWLDSASARRLREHLLGSGHLELLVELGDGRLFTGVSGRTLLYVWAPGPGETERIEVPRERAREALLTGLDLPSIRRVRVASPLRADGTIGPIDAPATVAGERADFLVSEGVTPGPERWTSGVSRRAAAALGVAPGSIEAERGIAPGEGVFVVPEEFALRTDLSESERALLLPWAHPAEVPAYPARATPTHRILYLRDEADGARAPRLLAHLARFRAALDRRRETALGLRPWFALHWPRAREVSFGPRVLLPRMCTVPRATYEDRPLVVGESVLVIRTGDAETARRAAATLNTRPLQDWLLGNAKRRGVGIDISVAVARAIPWPREVL